jgi:hypothetical protein
MIDDWIKDLESRVGKRLDFSQRALLLLLKEKSEYIGEISLHSKNSSKEQLFCYVPEKQQGWVLEKDEKGLGAVISYSGMSKHDFRNKYYPFAREETRQKVKKYSLITLPFMAVPAVYLAVKKCFEHRKKE